MNRSKTAAIPVRMAELELWLRCFELALIMAPTEPLYKTRKRAKRNPYFRASLRAVDMKWERPQTIGMPWRGCPRVPSQDLELMPVPHRSSRWVREVDELWVIASCFLVCKHWHNQITTRGSQLSDNHTTNRTQMILRLGLQIKHCIFVWYLNSRFTISQAQFPSKVWAVD